MPTKSDVADIAIDNSILSVRAVRALRKSGYRSLSECANLSVKDLLKIRNIGKKTANEIIDIVNSFKMRYQQAHLDDARPEESLLQEEKYLYWITVLSVPISKINLSVRATHILKNTGAHNLLELVKKKSDQISRIENCGKKTLREITDFLMQLELRLDERLEATLVQDVMSNISKKTEDEIMGDFKNKYPEKYNILAKAKINNNLDASKIKFYESCFSAYIEEGTLELVAKKMHLTRERIRQILNKGTQIGLFNYTGRDYNYIEKNKIIDDFTKHLTLRKVAQANGITSSYLKRMLTAYKITEKDLEALRLIPRKNKCIEFYRKIEAALGHPPTTTELQRRGWRYLSIKIPRIWGSIDAFREELRIPKPVRTFPEASRKWLEKRRRVAFIVRMQNIDQIRDCLTKRSPLRCSEIACDCNIKPPPKVLRLLNLLLARREIIREGAWSSVKYSLIRKQEIA